MSENISESESRDRLSARVEELEAIHCEVHKGEPTAEQPCPCCAAVRVAELEAKLATTAGRTGQRKHPQPGSDAGDGCGPVRRVAPGSGIGGEMSDRGLTWEEAMEFDRLQYASILKEKKQAEEKCPRCGGDGFVTKYACVTTRRVLCPACLGGKQ